MKYLVYGVRIGITAAAAIVTTTFLLNVSTAFIGAVTKTLKQNKEETDEKTATDNSRFSDDLK
jgi:hypothetical protein